MLNVEILCNPRIPVVKTSNVGFPNISYWWILEGLPSKYNPKPIHLLGSSPHLHGGFKDFLFKTPTCGLKPPTCHVLIKQKHLGWNWLESGFFHTLIFSETRHGAYLHPGLWTRYGVSMIKTQNQEVLTSNKFHTDSKGFNVFFFPLFFFPCWFQWFLMVAFLIVLLRRVWHVQCFCRCEIRSKSGNSVWVEPTDYSHTALKWAATTQQFRPFRQSCEANLLTSQCHGKSWHWRDIWNSKLARHGNTVWFRIHAWKSGKKVLKHHESTNQREDLLVAHFPHAFSTHFRCPFDAVMWDDLSEAGGVTYLTLVEWEATIPHLLHDFRKSKATKLTPLGSIWYLAVILAIRALR